MQSKIEQKSKLFSSVLGAGLVSALVLVSMPSEAANQGLASHRAVYDLTLNQLNEGGGVLDARGRIVLEIKKECDGFVTRQRMLVDIQRQGGGGVVSDFNFSSWESLEGDQLRFTSSDTINGRVAEMFDGFATANGSENKVAFNDEDKTEMKLPKDVMFPMTHTYKVLDAAKAGLPLLSARIFDGSSMDGLQDSLTIISKKGGKRSEVAKKSGMDKMRYWPIQMSFFDLRDRKDEPDYSIHFQIYENGVGDQLKMNYRDFSLKGKLTELELFEEPDCKN